MTQIPKGRFVKGPYKPICGDCAIYFSITVHSGKIQSSTVWRRNGSFNQKPATESGQQTGWKAKLDVEAGRAAWTGATKKTRMGNSRYKEVGEGLSGVFNLQKIVDIGGLGGSFWRLGVYLLSLTSSYFSF